MLIAALLLGAALAAQPAGGDHAAAPGALEGRPPAGALSPLQSRIDRAAAGAVIEVEPGTYAGDLVVDRPLTLVGRGRPMLVGSGGGSVIRIRAAGVTIEGFDIDGHRGGDMDHDSSGVHISGPRATVRNCRISNALFGVYVREAPGASIESTEVRGIPGIAFGEKGSGLHIYNTDGFRLVGNTILDARDGIYIQSSPHGFIARNRAANLRYGLHYMYSDDNVFEDNRFEHCDAGTAIMYSRRIAFRRNAFLHNRGFASVGLLFQACDDVIAESNLVADNARGIFLEGANRNVFRGNIVAESDTAIVMFDSCAKVRFEGNSFVGNLTPLLLVGRRTSTVFEGNYWSDNEEPDLDGDQRSDRPYRVSSVFDHFRGNLIAADLFSRGFVALAVSAAERAFPIVDPVPVLDASPLAHPPDLPLVPAPGARAGGANGAGLVVSGCAFAGGLGLAIGLRPRRRSKGGPP
jgi:nitrous oxidase accessory protein